MKFKFFGKEKIARLPKKPGVYCFKDKKEILYIGKAANLRERVKNHFLQPRYRDYLFLNKIKKIGYIKTNSEIEALVLEANLIKKHQPKFNVIWRDDKNYFFVVIAKEDFPKIFITHQIKNAELETRNYEKFSVQRSKFKIQYVGPFVDGKALKQTLKILRKVFPYRSCSKIPNRSCLWYHLGRCPAPCLLKSKFIKEILPNSLKIKKISQRNAKNLIRILKKGKNPVLKDLKKEMKEAIKKQDFEEAAKIRDQIEALERVIEHARIFEEKREKLESWLETEKKLREILKIKNEITRIEAFDISQIHGNFAVGSMVAFINGLPEKKFYRRFKIKFEKKPSDVDMLREILKRRFKHKEWGFPDLILVDGGKAQLNVAILERKNYCLKAKIMALAKKENKLFIEGKKEPIFLKNLTREIFNLILQLRDEAHRFALKYHQKLRERNLVA